MDTDQLGHRSAVPADIDWLLALRLETMSDYLEASGERLSVAEQLERLMWRFDAVEILTLGDEAVGMSKILREAPVWKLVQIQCLPRYQGSGIGSRIIRQLLSAAATAQCPVELSVLKVNPAQALYQRLGFQVIAEKAHSFTMRAQTGPLPSATSAP